MNDFFKKIKELNNTQIKELLEILNMRTMDKDYHSALKRFLMKNSFDINTKRYELKMYLDASINQKLDRLPGHIKDRLLDLYNYSLIEEEYFDDSDWNSIIEKFSLGISIKEYKPFLLKT